MNGIKLALRRFSYKFRHGFLSVENVVLLISIVLCLVLTYQSIVAMSRNWMLSERLTTERKKLELLSLEVEAGELENEYYKTDEFQELMARKHLDKKMPGENMIILPENSEEAINKHGETTVIEQEKEHSNFDKWMMYLFPSY